MRPPGSTAKHQLPHGDFRPVRNDRRFGFLRGTRGEEIAETAMILPLLFMFIMGIFWMGQAFRTYGSLTNAARAGVRAAVAPICTTCTSGTVTSPAQIAQAAAQNALAAASVNSANLVPNMQWTPPTLCQCKSGASACTASGAVGCDGTVSNMCVQVNVQLSYPSSQGGMYTCGTSVSMRYQYPYSFTIPLTNLNLGNIKLPGQAQMRSEQ